MEGLYLYGSSNHRQDWESYFAEKEHVSSTWLDENQTLPDDATCVFDLWIDENPDRLKQYAHREDLVVIGGGLIHSLSELQAICNTPVSCILVGINAWPGMLARPVWEISLLDDTNKAKAQSLFDELGVEVGFVQDRVGMATPRLLSMIINEAAFTVQEGTASEQDIDQAMKLGVNYPGGPFSWLAKFGHDRVVALLEKMLSETGNGRYKVCPKLKREARLHHVSQNA